MGVKECSHRQYEKLMPSDMVHCRQLGKRLTPLRVRLLTLLRETTLAVTAYELTARYSARYEPVKPMSIYRALDFLCQCNFVHRLESCNRYVACTCVHQHDHSDEYQIFFCDRCGNSHEQSLPRSFLKDNAQCAADIGFSIERRCIEIHGLCQSCRQQGISSS